MRNYFKETLLALSDAGINFIVGGGVAAVLHGVERVTMDLDLAVAMNETNLNKFISVMKGLDLKPRAPVPPEYLLNPENITLMVEEKHAVVFTFIDPDNPLRCVDLFLRDDHTYERLMEHSEEVILGGRPIRIISKEKLVELKRNISPPRQKDLLDIDELTHLLDQSNEKR